MRRVDYGGRQKFDFPILPIPLFNFVISEKNEIRIFLFWFYLTFNGASKPIIFYMYFAFKKPFFVDWL